MKTLRSPFDRQLLGARRLSLIGRTKALDSIRRTYQNLRNHQLTYFEGEGGIGKTVLLHASLQQLRQGERLGLPAERIIDLYHVDYQTPTGLASGIVRTLGNPRRYFKSYFDLVKRLRRQSPGETPATWDVAWHAFADGLMCLADEQGPLLIALDTVEILQYEYRHDPFQEEAGQQLPLASIGRWLLENLLPQLEGPIMWLWAGRPGQLGERLATLQHVSKPLNYSREELLPLSPQESRRYLHEVAVDIADIDPIGSCNLRQYINRYPAGIYTGTQGRPILLALAADILRVGGALPTRFYENKSVPSRETTKLEKELANHLLKLEPVVKDTLVAMSFLRKGANVKLLAQLLNIEDSVSTQRLRAIEGLTLVKKRPEGDRPYFLHDEMYNFFDKYIHIDDSERVAKLNEVSNFYDTQIQKVAERLGQTPMERTQLEAELRALEVEKFHYIFQKAPDQGFAEYFLQAEDALNGRDHETDMLLRTELLRTLDDLDRAGQASTELRRKIVLDAAIRWGVRTLLLENDEEAAMEIFNEVRAWSKGKTERFDQPLSWYLELYQGVTALKQNLYDEAEKRLAHVEEGLRKLDQFDKVVQVLEALTWNYLGYLSRLRGRYYNAVRFYQQATKRFRMLNMGSLVFTLINQAFAMAQIGHFRHARLILQETHKKAREENKPYWQANALNVRALVETADGHTRTGLRFASDALEILEHEIENHRLRGLILLTRARAYRYLWNDYVTEDRWRDIGLQEALLPAYNQLDGYEKGLTILRTSGGFAYTVEGLIESGCVFRSMAWADLHLSKGLLRRTILKDHLRIFEKAKDWTTNRFLEAAGIDNAEKAWLPQVQQQVRKLGGDPYLPTLSLVNLGWHFHYQRDDIEDSHTGSDLQSTISKVTETVYQIIPRTYHLPEPSVQREEAHISLWGVLGKLEMLSFHEAVYGWHTLNIEQKEYRLREAVKHAMYSLEYDHLMGDVSYDLRHAEEGLHRRLLKIHNWQNFVLPRLYEYEEKISKDLQPVLKEESTFRRWLIETLGPPSII